MVYAFIRRRILTIALIAVLIGVLFYSARNLTLARDSADGDDISLSLSDTESQRGVFIFHGILTVATSLLFSAFFLLYRRGSFAENFFHVTIPYSFRIRSPP